MEIISFKDVNKSFVLEKVLQDITFNIKENDKIGLVGKNGSGKSTLLKILVNELSKDSGEIYIRKDISMSYLSQDISKFNNMKIFDYCLLEYKDLIETENKLKEYEDSFLRIKDNDILIKETQKYNDLLKEYEDNNGFIYKSEVKGILNGLGFDFNDQNRLIKELSEGQKIKLSLAKILIKKADVLLLDEPTNHLDISSITWLENFLKNSNQTFIVVSHDRYFLDKVTNKIFELKNKSITMYNGNYSEYIIKRDIKYKNELQRYNNQQKLLKEQINSINDMMKHQTELLSKRAKSKQKQLQKIDIIEKPSFDSKKLGFKIDSFLPSGHEVLHLINISKEYNKLIFKDVNLDIYSDDMIGIIGKNGIGKTTLLKIINNELEPSFGEVKYGTNVFIGYHSQNHLNLNYNNTLVEEISDAYPKMDITTIRNYLGRFLFVEDDVFKKVSDLSGGEKARLNLLKLMLSKTNVLLLDEPTNHLDLESKEVLEEALLEYSGTIISVSHDRYFLNKLSNKIIELKEDGIKVYLGNYDYYESKKLEDEMLLTPFKDNITKTKLKDERKLKNKQKREISQTKKDFKILEENIEEHEKNIEILELSLCDELVYTDGEKVKNINEKIKKLKDDLEILYSRWEESLNN